MSTCNRLDLQTLGSQPIMPTQSPRVLSRGSFRTFAPLSSSMWRVSCVLASNYDTWVEGILY